jgi:Tfp pilus assembly protein PilE
MLQREECFYTEYNTYTTAFTDFGYPSGPYNTKHQTHSISLAAGPTGVISTSISLSAAPIVADTRCGTLTLTSTRVMTASGCW